MAIPAYIMAIPALFLIWHRSTIRLNEFRRLKIRMTGNNNQKVTIRTNDKDKNDWFAGKR